MHQAVEEKAKTVLKKVRQRTVADVDSELRLYSRLALLGKCRGEVRPVPGRIDRLLDDRLRLSKVGS